MIIDSTKPLRNSQSKLVRSFDDSLRVREENHGTIGIGAQATHWSAQMPAALSLRFKIKHLVSFPQPVN
jgi:hypothetical protein